MKVALLFSGGLDSTYAAISLKRQGHEVDLYHFNWTWFDRKNAEVDHAWWIAAKLGLKFYPVADIHVHPHYRPFQIPAMLTMLICNRLLTEIPKEYETESRRKYDAIAMGCSPKLYHRDKDWAKLIEPLMASLQIDLQVLYPRDGVTRQEQWKSIPDDIKPMIFSCMASNELGLMCGTCDKCLEDRRFRDPRDFC